MLTMLYVYHYNSTVSVCHKGDGKLKFTHSLTVVSLLCLSNPFTSNQSFFSLHWTDANFPKWNGKTSNRRIMYSRSSTKPLKQL